MDSEFPPTAADQAAFHVIPAPLELGVSYGGGCAMGPQAILRASRELEVLLEDGHGCPGKLGIHTTLPVPCPGNAETSLDSIRVAVAKALESGAMPILLGGEHTVTLGAARALREGQREPVGFLHFDAHADLRHQYQGNPLSHACVMRRVSELGFPVFQVATRSLSPEDVAYRRAAGIQAADAGQLCAPNRPLPSLPADFPQDLYLTFDLDALDPSIMPATGTPEPGGIDWRLALELIAGLTRGRRLIGFDVVELAPIPGLHHAEYTAAKLVYQLMEAGDMGRD